jgi:uncharacterized protein YjbI with pentapeptide repeats
MEKDFDGNPITEDSRVPDWGETREWQKKNPGISVWSVRSAIITAKKQALREYKKKQRQAARRIPRGGNKFEGKDLSLGNFKNAKINYGKFNGANLEWSDLSDVNFKYADLLGANLSNVQAQDVNLSRANLMGADLSFARLDFADLRGADLRKVNFGPKIITSGPDKGKWEGRAANLKGANLNNCDLWTSSFLRCEFQGSDFRRANFHGSDFRASQFKRANFAYATIDDARGLDKIWKNDKFGSLKFIPHKNQPNTANPRYDKSKNVDPRADYWNNPKLYGSRALLREELDTAGNVMLQDQRKAILTRNRLSKTPQLTYLAESNGLMAEDWEAKWSSNAVVIIDNSGSTGMKSGVTHKESGHEMSVLDRHVMTAAIYLTNFPKQGNYRIITPRSLSSSDWGEPHRDFDNTDDAIEYLFTIRPEGGGFNGLRSDRIDELTKAYNNVLLIQDEHLLI